MDRNLFNKEKGKKIEKENKLVKLQPEFRIQGAENGNLEIGDNPVDKVVQMKKVQNPIDTKKVSIFIE